MKASFGWFWRIVFLLVVGAGLVVGLLLAKASSWKADTLARLAEGAELHETSKGPQQCAVTGEGLPVVVIHGAVGGYDQGLAIADAMPWEGIQIISPSRPGYLGTPLGPNILPAQQAEALAALLDSLGQTKVHLLAFGTGTPVALEFAARFPGRVDRMVLVSGVYERPKPPAAGERPLLPEDILQILGGDVTSAAVAWALENDPADTLQRALPVFSKAAGAEADFVKTHADQSVAFTQFVQAMLPISVREPGLRNDILQIKTLQPPLPTAIQVPTLVVHGNQDPLQTMEGARQFANKIPGAVFLSIETSGHLPWLGPDGNRASQAIVEFLTKPAP
jgi:pimeloyl-ACP methyl ester carboxylesterase